MKVFVLGVPHTQSTEEFSTCAFTAHVRNLCKMLTRLGHHVVHLGVEGSDPKCSENVDVVPIGLWRKTYGGHPGSGWYDTRDAGPKYEPLHRAYAENALRAVAKRTSSPLEAIVCVTWPGGGQRVVGEKLRGSQYVVESGVGYRHTFASYRVFHSYAWMHAVHGYQDGADQRGGHWYDVVVPYAVDVSLFEYRRRKGDYFLYLGRLQDDKGVDVACQVAGHAGVKLLLAGQGPAARYLSGRSRVTSVGAVGPAERRELLAGARALLCPTIYVEPFGAVAVEAQMSGTPVICTDWGGFTETVQHGITGYRCRTMEQFGWAARHVEEIDPEACRSWAWLNYRLDAVGPRYDEYFRMLENLNTGGWYANHQGRTERDWLRARYPESFFQKSFGFSLMEDL